MTKLLLMLFSFLVAEGFASGRTLDLSALTTEQRTTLEHQFPSVKAANFTSSDLDAIIRYLITHEKFESAAFTTSTTNGETIYKLFVKRAIKIVALRFTGLDAYSELEVRREFGLSEKSAFDRELVLEAGQRLAQFYKEHGYLRAIVDLEFRQLSPTEMDILVKVTENKLTKVDTFHVISPNPTVVKDLTKELKSFKGSPYTESILLDIRKSCRSFLSEHQYYKSEISDPVVSYSDDLERVNIELKVDKVDRYTLEYEGYWQMSPSNIGEALHLDNFFSSNPNIGPELSSRIRDFYLSQGFARAEVEAEESETSEAFHRRIKIKIQEGPHVTIDKILVTGRLSQGSDFYSDFILGHSSPVVKKDYYVRDDIDKGLNNLLIDRRNNGYIKARVVSTRTSYNKDRDHVTIYVNLDEGPLTNIQRISFDGLQHFSEENLLNELGLHPQEPLRLNLLDEGIQKLKDHYRGAGYLEMNILNEKEDLVTYNDDNTLAHIRFHIYEGPQVIVNNILIEGTTLTKDYVILKELEFKKGDILTPALIDESIRRLQRVGHFNTIDIRTLEEKTPIAKRTVLVKVTDRDPGLFNMGVGATDERYLTLRGFTGLAYRNIGGTGRGVSGRVDLNYNVADVRYPEYKIAFGYLEPYLFNTRTHGRVNFNQSVYIVNYTSQLATDVRQFVGSVEQDLTSHLFVSWDVWNFAKYRDFYINDSGPGNELNIGSTGPTINLDYRDHPFNPTRGSVTRLNIEYGNPALGGDSSIHFLRSTLSYTHYWSPRSKIVWANSIRGGLLSNLKSPDEGGYVPYDKKGFVLGGQSTIRGFLPTEGFPNARELGTDQYQMTTNASMYLIKSEVRFPLVGNIGGAVFYDGGAVYIQGLSFDTPYRHSAGVAATYSTPVGSVSLEYAWKLNAKGSRDENPSVLHFSIGTF